MAAPRRSLPRWLRLGLWLLAALVVAGMLEAAFIVLDGLHDRPGKADVALVLGNTVEANGQPAPWLAARLDRAAVQYRQGDFPVIIVSGGKGSPGGDEAVAMRAYLLAKGIPAESIIADSEGVNTYESARFTSRLMRERGWRSACVVTEYFHVPRSRLALRRFGVGTVYSAHARHFRWRDGYSLLREMAGLVKYTLRSYPDPAPPAPSPTPAGAARGGEGLPRPV